MASTNTNNAHLTEFFNLVNNKPGSPSSTTAQQTSSYTSTSTIAATTAAAATAIPAYSSPVSPTAHLAYRRPSISSLGTAASASLASTNFAAGMAQSHPDLPALITSREVADTVQRYNGVVEAARRYSEALIQVSAAAAEFGSALEDCARCKGAGASAESLMAAGGLHFLVSNHHQILAKSIHRSFEVPVRRQVESFKKTMAQNDEMFKSELRTRTRMLKRREVENQRLSRMRVRNLAAYKHSLLELTAQIDDIDKLKYEHFRASFEEAQDTSARILSFAGSVVRAEVEIYEGIARKGWSGGGLDDLIASCPDPFAPDEDEDEYEDTDGPSTGDSVSTLKKKKTNGNGFVNSVKTLLSPLAAMKTGEERVPESPDLSSSSVPKSAASSAPKQSLFSILPTKSILPTTAPSSAVEPEEEVDNIDDDKNKKQEVLRKSNDDNSNFATIGRRAGGTLIARSSESESALAKTPDNPRGTSGMAGGVDISPGQDSVTSSERSGTSSSQGYSKSNKHDDMFGYNQWD